MTTFSTTMLGALSALFFLPLVQPTEAMAQTAQAQAPPHAAQPTRAAAPPPAPADGIQRGEATRPAAPAQPVNTTPGARGMLIMGVQTGSTDEAPEETVETAKPRSPLLPAFPGAAHIYHYGATGFFLDRPEQIQLTQVQRTALLRIRAAAARKLADADRQISRAEDEVWLMTGAESPDVSPISLKLGQIERLKTEQRLEFMRHVGQAARVLTDGQRRVLCGTAPARPAGTPTPAANAPPANPAPAGPSHEAQPGTDSASTSTDVYDLPALPSEARRPKAPTRAEGQEK